MSTREAAIKHFKAVDRRFYKATLAHHSSLPKKLPGKRTSAELFTSLASIVISQQLGTAAADTIFERVEKACGGKITPLSLAKVPEPKLRAAGLSGSKMKTLKSIARAVQSGAIDLLALKKIPEEVAAEKLTSFWGVGPWSAEMFLMFALGRSDVFSSGDLGLVRSIEKIYGFPKNTPVDKILALSESWSPHRTYACLLLWRTRDAKPLPKLKGRHR